MGRALDRLAGLPALFGYGRLTLRRSRDAHLEASGLARRPSNPRWQEQLRLRLSEVDSEALARDADLEGVRAWPDAHLIPGGKSSCG
jgi:hypothetical protein